VLPVRSGRWAGIGDRAAEADVIPHDIDAGWILEEIVHIRLTNAESSVNVSAIVSFATFGHCCCSPVIRGDLPRMWQAAGPGHRETLNRCATPPPGPFFVARRAAT
jgi:hypothetical protein